MNSNFKNINFAHNFILKTMKKIKCPRSIMVILVLLFAVSSSNCSVNWRTNRSNHSYKAKKLPPGHAKKLHGEKSAKKYAPGHNK
ncbi:MAG: hypothetical protein ACI884_001777 [Ulvibacter sp.]|jgi:hypothetical protein